MKRGAKRGMSPLIATVLLIAFAVSLGAMIMNWSSSIGEGQAKECNNIKLIMSPSICHSASSISIGVKNIGSEVALVTVKIIDESATSEIAIKNSKIASGDRLEKSIPYEKTGKTSLSLIPSVQHNHQLVKCEKPALEVADIAACTN